MLLFNNASFVLLMMLELNIKIWHSIDVIWNKLMYLNMFIMRQIIYKSIFLLVISDLSKV